MITRYTFDEVSLIGHKSGKCRCGKRVKRQMKFWQTLNPYNVGKTGNPKTRSEIISELQKQIEDWKQESVLCTSCEQGAQP